LKRRFERSTDPDPRGGSRHPGGSLVVPAGAWTESGAP
jgi:hypothetical protein